MVSECAATNQVPKNNAGDPRHQSERTARASDSGTHTQQVTPDLLVRAQLRSCRTRSTTNSSVTRARCVRRPVGSRTSWPTQRLLYGNAYLLGQYLQPLQEGGKDTFQRLPELGYALPILRHSADRCCSGWTPISSISTGRKDSRRSRVDLVPGLSTDVLDIGHVVGFTPQVKFREVYYSRGVSTDQSLTRETFWAALDATSKMSRRFSLPRRRGHAAHNRTGRHL